MGNTPIGATVDLAGTYLYVANGNANTVTSFPLDGTTGALGAPITSTFGVGETGMRGMTMDPSGKFIVASGNKELISVLAVGDGGTVSMLPNPVHGTAGSWYDPLVVAH